MADVTSLLDQYINAGNDLFDPKKSAVAAAAYAKKQALSQGGYRGGAVDDVGLTPPDSLEAILGTDPSAAVAQNAGRTDYVRDATGERSVPRAALDLGITGFTAAVQGIPQLANIPISAVSPEAGAAVTAFINEGQANADAKLSDALAGRRRAFGARNEVTGDHNEELFKRDEKSDGSFVASLKRIGRDTLSGLSNMDAANVGDITGQGLGSLATAGPLGKAFGFLGKAAMPTAIGAQEAAGAHHQVMTEVLGMTHEQLMAGSDEYRTMIQNGAAPDEAKATVARDAALTAAATQFPTAAATGLLVSKFEASPFRVSGVRRSVGDMLRETLEEGSQSATGQLAANTGIKAFADENRDLSEGVGENIAQGAVGGLGSAAVIQAPGLAVRGAVEAAMLPVRGVQAIMRRGDRVLDAASAEQAAKQTAQMDGVAAAAADPEVQTAVADAIKDPSKVETLFNGINFDPAELENSGLTPGVQDSLKDSTNRFDALRRAASVVTNKETESSDKLSAGLFLLDQLNNYQKVVGDLQAAIEEVPDDHASLPTLREFEDVLLNIRDHPEIQAALGNALKFREWQKSELSKKDLGTPEAEQTINNAVGVSTHRPELANPELNGQILAMASSGDIELTPHQKAALESATALIKAAQEKQAAAERMKLQNVSDLVSKEIRTDEGDEDAKSAAQHMRGVQEAMRVGNTELAKQRLQDLRMFAEHMQNKVSALNEHLVSGDWRAETAVPYKRLTLNRKWLTPANKSEWMWVNPIAPKSIRNAQRIALDAQAVTTVANVLSLSYPELGLLPLTPVNLDPRLDGPADQVRKRFKALKRPEPQNESTPEPEDKGQPEGGDKSVEVKPEARKAEQPAETEDSAPVKEEQAKPAPEPETVAEKRGDESASSEDAAPVEEFRETDEKSKQSETVRPETDEKTVPEKAAEPEKSEANQQPDTAGDTAGKPAGNTGPNLFENPEKGIRNQFKRVFKFPKEAKSRLVGEDSPLQTVKAALASPVKYKEFAGRLSHKLTPELIKAYDRYVTGGGGLLGSILVRRLNESLNSKYSNGKTIRENLLNGPEKGKRAINRQKDFKALNLVEVEGDNVGYNSQLVEAAVLAGLQWVLMSSDPERYLDEDEVSDILGIPSDDVDAELLEHFTTGVSVQEAVQNIGQMITRYWGVTPDRNAPEGYVKGIPEALAKEILLAMEEAKLIEAFDLKGPVQTHVNKDGSKVDFSKTYLRYRRSKNKNFVQMFKALNQFPSAIEELVAVDPEGINYIGTPPEKAPTHQMSNRMVETTDQQKKAAENQQHTPYFLNRPFISLMKNLGGDAILEMFGHGDLSNKNLNVNYRESLEGTNRTLAAAYEQMLALEDEVENVAAEMGNDPAETAIYYAFGFSRVNRMHQLGKHNPQANKFMREVSLPTWATVDLSSENGADFGRFMLGVAQHWGLKVETMRRSDSVKQALQLAKKDYKGTIAILQEWLERQDSNRSLQLNAADIQTFKSEFGDKLTPGAFHAAMEYARYLNAKDKSKFTTSLYVEADGKTDGPINAIMHLAFGLFSPRWLELMAKGGLFIGSGFKTINDYVQSNVKGASHDLYKTTTMILQDNLVQFRDAYSKRYSIHTQMEALWTVMDELLGKDFVLSDGQILTERGLIKNPLTVTIYGSGEKGIANKIAHTLIKEYYRRISVDGGATLTPEATKAFQMLFSSIVVKTQKGLVWIDKKDETPGAKGKEADASDLKLSREQVENLRTNLKTLFVKPLAASIDEVIEPVLKGKELLRKTVQVQSIFLRDMFQQKIEDALNEKAKNTDDPDFRRDEFLSQAEMEKIFNELKKDYPFIDTGTQIFFPSATQKMDFRSPDEVESNKKSAPEFSRTLDGKLGTPAYINGVTNAGVRGIPFMIIGPGDGQMMQNVATMDDAPQGVMLVFDGMNMKLSSIEDDSRKVNQAVYDAWLQGNPLRDVHNAYSQFFSKIKHTDINKLSDKGQSDLFDAVFRKGTEERETASSISAYAAMIDLEVNISDMALISQARKEVLAEVNLAVDHMATAEGPFEVTDKLALEGSFDEVAEKLNELLREKLKKLPLRKYYRNAKTAAEIAAEKINEKVTEPKPEPKSETDDLKPVIDPKSGAKVLTLADLKHQAGVLAKDEGQKAFIQDLLRVMDGTNYKFVIGSIEELQVHAQQVGEQKFPTMEDFAEQNFYGLTSPTSETIYFVGEPNKETIIHELIHAATFKKVASVYADPAKANQQDREAVMRLDALMVEWVKTQDTEEAYEQMTQTDIDVYNAVTGYLEKGIRAAALNEFMAWNLSNRELILKAQQTVVKTKLGKIAKKVLDALKQLLWKGNAPSVDKYLFSNLRFNTQVLLRSDQTIQQRLNDVVLHQSSQFGNNERLTKLREQFGVKMARLVSRQTNPLDQDNARQDVTEALARADQVAMSFISNGFSMNMQEQSTFRMLVATFMTEAHLDPNSLVRVQNLYTHVTKNLKVEDFKTRGINRYWAQKRFDLVMGNYHVETDRQKRSTLLPAFVALAAVNEDFRKILANMEVPKVEKAKNDTLDNIIENAGVDLMERLSAFTAGEKRNAPDVNAALDALTTQIADQVEDQETYIGQFTSRFGNAMDAGNKFIVDSVNKLASKGIDKLEGLGQQTNNKYAQVGLKLGELFLSAASEDRAENVAKGIMEFINRMDVWRPLHDLVTEFVGRTSDNAVVYDMIKMVRAAIQQIRQQFREHLPETINSEFSRKITEEEWTALFHGLGKTDIAALTDAMSQARVMSLISDHSQIAAEISGLEDRIRGMQPDNWNLLQTKSKELAAYMNTGKVPGNLLRNAWAIAHLYGTSRQRNANGTPELIKLIDQLVTLYAIDGLDQNIKDTVSSLARTEAKGVKFTLAYLVGQRKDEMEKVRGSLRSTVNHYKGYVPSEQEAGVSLIVAEDREAPRLKLLGFQRVGDYGGSDAEIGAKRKGYYYAPLSGRAMYNQGILQNVRHTAYGVDPMTGYSVGVPTAGRITAPEVIRHVRRSYRYNEGSSEPLMPIYDTEGHVVAYERSLDPEQDARLNRNTDLAKAIGQWRGRQVEEAKADQVNRALIDALAAQWNEGRGTDRSAYVNVFSRQGLADPVVRDAVALMTPQTRAYIEDAFGENEFWVRKDMLNNTLGYRSPTVGDAWTGTSRWNNETRRVTQRVATGVFGQDAFKYLMTAEKFWQNFVADARRTIVVKSVIVPVSNLIANTYQLMARGVPIADIVKGIPKKTAEIDAFVKGRVRRIELEAQLRAAEGENATNRITKIKAQIKLIKDANRRLSIWPLIEAGEFSSISDAGITQDEILLSEGRLNAYMEKLTDKLPDSVKTLGRYAVISRDTALFKGLQRAVEYGDFLGKAILYDELTKRQKKSKEYALGRITEEFVNYDFLAGRSRTYLENMGLLWFWNFKVRSTKIALSILRNNPLHMLFASLVPAPETIGSIGSPLSDNIFSVAAEGNLDYSMGPGQAFAAHSLNPWWNLWN